MVTRSRSAASRMLRARSECRTATRTRAPSATRRCTSRRPKNPVPPNTLIVVMPNPPRRPRLREDAHDSRRPRHPAAVPTHASTAAAASHGRAASFKTRQRASPAIRRRGRALPQLLPPLGSDCQRADRDHRCDDAADEHRRQVQRAIPCGAHRGGTNPRCRRVRRHRVAVMAEAQDSVHLHLADAEECDRLADRVARKALAAQPRVGERDAQRRVVGPQGRPLGAGQILDLVQGLEPPAALALQDLGPTLEPLALRERTAVQPTRLDISDIADLIQCLVFHDVLQLLLRQIDCHLSGLYAWRPRTSRDFSATIDAGGRATLAPAYRPRAATWPSSY